MKRPYVIGLTGGIAAGKSTVLEYLASQGEYDEDFFFDCDAAVHRMYQHPIMRAWLAEKFGAIGEDARQACAKMVQTNPNVIDILEKMFIPAVQQELEDKIRNSLVPYIIVDAPLLFETGLNKMCDEIIVVHAPEEVRRARALQRPSMTPEKLNIMISRQIKDDMRLALADYVINTDCSREETHVAIEKVINELKEKVRDRFA